MRPIRQAPGFRFAAVAVWFLGAFGPVAAPGLVFNLTVPDPISGVVVFRKSS